MAGPQPYRQLLIRRDLLANMPTLAIGEPFFATDTEQLFVGTQNGNMLIGGEYEAQNSNNWVAPVPTTMLQAIQRIEAAVALLRGSPIP